MKTVAFLVCAVLPALANPLAAESLHSAGVLGNSGEQGATLVRFGARTTGGLGVVHDAQGSLWDRGGEGVLNRYAVDGRLLASYPLPAIASSPQSGDTLARLNEHLVLKLGRKLHVLPIDAPAGTAPTPLPAEATRLSFGSSGGWLAAARDKEVFLINAAGETRPVAALETAAEDIEQTPDGAIYVRSQGKVRRIDAGAPADARGPWGSPGDRLQWLDGHWFGVAWHGTIRRFSGDFMPAPGVVLGGASGSFIGYVEGNHELNLGRGLAHLGGNLYAVSGIEGVLHVLEWNPTNRRFTLVRRIGAVAASSALALDSEGRVWSGCGMWEWTDGPDTPLRHGVPPPDAPGLMGAVMLPGDVMVAPAVRWGQKSFYAGKLNGPVGSPGGVEGLPKDGVACAVVTWDKRQALLVVNKTGAGTAFFVSAAGRHEGKAGDVTLEAATPITLLTSLTAPAAGVLIAAADGGLIEFASGPGNTWRETRRWNSWGPAPASRFGGKVFAASGANRIWVSDTERHRVLCFDLSTGRPVVTAVFGVADQAGDSLGSLDRPQTLAVNGRRGIVFDAGNQRLVRLELQTP